MTTQLWLYYIIAIATLVMVLSLVCTYKCLKVVPYNYIYLAVFTLFESYTVATLTGFYKPEYVLYAAILTLVMSVTLSVYACFTKTDFTVCGCGLLIVGIAVSVASLILMLTVRNHYAMLVIAWITLILASVYLIYDTQLIVGGQGRKYQLTYDDYIIGSMMLYTDVILLFIEILRVMGGRRR